MKLKSHSGAKKRFGKTGSGKIRRRKAYKSHILTSKKKKRKRRLGKPAILSDSDEKRIAALIPYA